MNEFTFQYVSINTLFFAVFLGSSPLFTFQYVSINTCQTCHCGCVQLGHLHSNMFLLILVR